jgi:hypothetical protein
LPLLEWAIFKDVVHVIVVVSVSSSSLFAVTPLARQCACCKGAHWCLLGRTSAEQRCKKCSEFSNLLIVAKVPELSCIFGAAISSRKQQREEQFDKSFTQVLKHHGAFDAESMAHYD